MSKYRLTSQPDVVVLVETGAFVPRGSDDWADYEACLAGGELPEAMPAPYAPHSPQHYQAIRTAAWGWMTAWVQERRYDTIESCCSYASSTVPRYKAEALAMIEWRDDVNQALEQLVLAPPAGIETWEQVRDLLPQPSSYSWPGTLELPLEIEQPVQLP